jgi:hypothetical protein
MEYCISKGYIVRLVKGFYADGDISNRKQVTDHYELLAIKFLIHSKLKHLALATHDRSLVTQLLKYIQENNIDSKNFSIQWFRGIQDDYYVD